MAVTPELGQMLDHLTVLEPKDLFCKMFSADGWVTDPPAGIKTAFQIVNILSLFVCCDAESLRFRLAKIIQAEEELSSSTGMTMKCIKTS